MTEIFEVKYKIHKDNERMIFDLLFVKINCKFVCNIVYLAY